MLNFNVNWSGSMCDKNFICIGEIADRLNCSESKARKLAAEGVLGIYIPNDKQHFYSVEEVDRYIAESKITSSKWEREELAFSYVLNKRLEK